MIKIVLGNIIALIASILMVYSGLINKKNKILLVQSIQISLSILSNIILGGITGAIINFVGLIRNIICYKNKLSIMIKIIISIISIILCIKFNNLGLIGYLPLISTLVYIWLMTIKDVKKFKLLIAFTMFMWLIYDIQIKSYTSSIFDLLCFIANVYTSIKFDYLKK